MCVCVSVCESMVFEKVRTCGYHLLVDTLILILSLFIAMYIAFSECSSQNN